MRQAKEMESRPGVLCVSLFQVGSYIDIPDTGCGPVVITNGDPALAERLARELAASWWDVREEFLVPTMSVAEAIDAGRRIEGGPVLLLDTADTTGGGAAGDSIALVKGLLEARVAEPCLAMAIDPEVAARCATLAPGAMLTADIGHKIDPQWGQPLRVTAELVRTSDGRFRYSGGIFGGTWSSMGPSAVLRIVSIELLVMSHPTYDWAYEQYESVGLDPRAGKFVGVKNMMNFRKGYAGIMKGFFVARLPGPTPIEYRDLPFERLSRPMYPFDVIGVMPEPRIAHSGTLSLTRGREGAG
jgi:microcystin degradation protein MlrC